MIKQKKAQIWGYTFMLGVIILVLALALTNPVKVFVDDARNSTQMDCNNASIDNFRKGACLVADMNIFYFIGGLIFIAGGIIVARIAFA